MITINDFVQQTCVRRTIIEIILRVKSQFRKRSHSVLESIITINSRALNTDTLYYRTKGSETDEGRLNFIKGDDSTTGVFCSAEFPLSKCGTHL